MTTHRTWTRKYFVFTKPAKVKTDAYVALCSCGWVSKELWTRRNAENEADQHVIAMGHVDE